MSDERKDWLSNLPYELKDIQGGSTGLWVDNQGNLTTAGGNHIGQLGTDGQIYDLHGRVIGRLNPYTGRPEWIDRDNPVPPY